MRIMLLSDIHLEFLGGGASYIDRLDPTDVDVLVLAGDVATREFLTFGLTRICSRFANVTFVAGNHEFYGSNPEAVKRDVRDLEAKTKNLHFLDNDVWEHQGVKFAGTTLWFPELAGNKKYHHSFSDFAFIRPARKTAYDWIYEEHMKSRAFLAEQASMADVFVTHHIPSYKAVSPRWVGSELNPFFVGDVTDIIESIDRPTTWLFGHSHDPGKFKIGQANLVINPKGYPSERRAPGFLDKLILEIGK